MVEKVTIVIERDYPDMERGAFQVDRGDGPRGETAPQSKGRWPDFFILGAPKCGTSSFYAHLGGHPDIFVPKVKEPNYFCEDLPSFRKRKEVSHYQALYSRALAGSMCGDGSVWQLFSTTAVPGIEANVPGARYFVLLRDPAAAAFSLHKQLLHALEEDIEDFDEAWDAQDDRAKGKRIPPRCREPKVLQYRDLYDYPPQLKRLFAHVPRERIRIYVFEELILDPHRHYIDALDFLGLPDDGRADFPAEEGNMFPRNRTLADFMRRTLAPIWWEIADKRLIEYYDTIAAKFGWPRSLAVKDAVRALAFEPRPKVGLSRETKANLRIYFAPSVAETERLLDRDLSIWNR